MDIHSLVKRFCELEGAEVGRGPKHPTHPNPDLAGAVGSFLEKYPFLKRDAGYVEFLECYAGAYLLQPGDKLVIDAFGFTHVSTYMFEEGDQIVDDGYLTFLTAHYRLREGPEPEDVQYLAFAFDATGRRRAGVYRQVVSSRPQGPVFTDWYCDTFLELFRDLIDRKGRLAP